MAVEPVLRLNSGYGIPQLGFGTFDAPRDAVGKAVKTAIDAGYRHIDCAMFYRNEEEVGAAIAESLTKNNLKREDLFITSKEGVEFDLKDPNTLVYENHKLEDTWKAMESLISAGLVKSIGVSNFNRKQLERIMASGTIVPAVNQVEVNLHWLNTKLIDFCHSHGIQVEAYAPFGSPGVMKGKIKSLLDEENVVEIAKEHKKTTAQVLLRHAIQRNIVVLTKSVTVERVKSNFEIFDFVLTDAEMKKLNSTGSNTRIFEVPSMSKHPEYPFHDEY